MKITYVPIYLDIIFISKLPLPWPHNCQWYAHVSDAIVSNIIAILVLATSLWLWWWCNAVAALIGYVARGVKSSLIISAQRYIPLVWFKCKAEAM